MNVVLWTLILGKYEMASLKEEPAKKKEQKQSKCPIDQYTKAIKSISSTRSLDKNPSLAAAYNNRGICYQAQKNYTRAIKDYNQSIILKDYFSKKLKLDEIYNSRALCYMKLDEYQLALADFNEALQFNPNSYTVLNNRGNYYSKQGEYKLALDDYNKAIKIEPDNYAVYISRGNCYVEQKNNEIALADFNKAIELNPNSAIAYGNRAACYLYLGKKELAVNDYEKSISLPPNNGNLNLKLSEKNKDFLIKELKGKLDEKNKELNNLIAMFAHNFLGTLQCIRSNAEHDNNPKIHLKTVKMMSGALTAFSIISADDDKLIEQLKQDNTGETNLLQNLANNLALAISQLLSKTNKDKIINIYLNYLRKTAQIKPETNGEDLRFNENDWEKWNALQQQWEDEFNALFSENVELSRLQTWLETNFFPVQISGFNDCTIRFKEYGITDSIFLVVFMEILVNALKYMDVSKNKPLIITLCKENQTYQLTCENPSAQESYRGTHKGMDFLKSIAKKVNGQFITESTAQSFKTTFIIPAELLE